ncbi:MAG: hypothetical protein IPM77_01385 [Crocinitomicaceae bacterium]|nr:hypothetical protein [Crocinitomicaceae bacterium]
MGLEFGVMIGALAGMMIYDNKPERIPVIFAVAVGILILIVIYLLTFGRKKPEKYSAEKILADSGNTYL